MCWYVLLHIVFSRTIIICTKKLGKIIVLWESLANSDGSMHQSILISEGLLYFNWLAVLNQKAQNSSIWYNVELEAVETLLTDNTIWRQWIESIQLINVATQFELFWDWNGFFIDYKIKQTKSVLFFPLFCPIDRKWNSKTSNIDKTLNKKWGYILIFEVFTKNLRITSELIHTW